MSELKPCPFCGNEAEIISMKGLDDKEIHWYVMCKSKGDLCGGHVSISQSKDLAIKRWNARPAEIGGEQESLRKV